MEDSNSRQQLQRCQFTRKQRNSNKVLLHWQCGIMQIKFSAPFSILKEMDYNSNYYFFKQDACLHQSRTHEAKD
jgi:hypothetical protein